MGVSCRELSGWELHVAREWGRQMGCESVHGHEWGGLCIKWGAPVQGKGAEEVSVRLEMGSLFRKWRCGAVVCLEGGCMARRGRETRPQVGHSTEGFNCHCEESGLSQGGVGPGGAGAGSGSMWNVGPCAGWVCAGVCRGRVPSWTLGPCPSRGVRTWDRAQQGSKGLGPVVWGWGHWKEDRRTL